jgi:hypothetical protein
MTNLNTHDVLLGTIAAGVSIWCNILAGYAVLSDRRQKAAMLKALAKAFEIRLRHLGEELRKANISL